jgi:hypothetical protein
MLTNLIGRSRSTKRLERYRDPVERIFLALTFVAMIFLGVCYGFR